MNKIDTICSLVTYFIVNTAILDISRVVTKEKTAVMEDAMRKRFEYLEITGLTESEQYKKLGEALAFLEESDYQNKFWGIGAVHYANNWKLCKKYGIE